jgi:hypothetical protein
MNNQTFNQFLDQVLQDHDLDLLFTLGYVPARHKGPSAFRREWEETWRLTDPDHLGGWKKTPATAGECFRELLAAGLSDQNYLYFDERRSHGEVRFHMFTQRWNTVPEDLKREWKEICGGWAFYKELDYRGPRGLIGHFLKAGHLMVMHYGEFQGEYTATDFLQWRR